MNTIQGYGVNYNINHSYNKGIDSKKTVINNRRRDSSETHISTEVFTKFIHEEGYTDYKVSTGEPYKGITASSMDALFFADARKKFNNQFDELLEKNNFSLAADEKLKLTVNKDYRVKVMGMANEERNNLLEDILNSERGFGESLLFHIQPIKAFNGKLDHQVFDKWHVYDFLKKVGQDMDDLKIEDGELIGASDKFQKIIDAGESSLYYGMVEKTKEVLTKGIDNIADIEESIEFYNGSFNDIDVKYGFGENQVDNWLDDYTSGYKLKNKSINVYG